jgi:RNA polymerase sigma factor (TIGR02999 family)
LADLVKKLVQESNWDITALLRAWNQGDQTALEALVPLVEGQLRRIAKARLEGNRADPLLDTTAVINEAYVRLISPEQRSWQDRAHFFAACARIMRHIVVDHARASRSAKRGGGRMPISLDETLTLAVDRSSEVVAVDDALEALADVDGRKARVVELRFFAGLNIAEAAEVLKVSPETVRRDWRLAKAWLMKELGRGKPDDS